MLARFARRLVLSLLCLTAIAPLAQAQGPAQVKVCHCAAAPYAHYHPGAGGPGYRSSNSGIAPGAAGPVTGLPRGRRYYGGRFFGSFNNRYYSPQYGYF